MIACVCSSLHRQVCSSVSISLRPTERKFVYQPAQNVARSEAIMLHLVEPLKYLHRDKLMPYLKVGQSLQLGRHAASN